MSLFLLKHFLPSTERKDIIIGYRADDSYFSFARTFLANTITVEQLRESMMLGDLGEQYMPNRRASIYIKSSKRG